MSPLQISLIVIGSIVIIVSCFLVDKSQKVVSSVGKTITLDNIFTDEDGMQLKHKIDDLLKASREETVIRTDDELSKISNEKILAVNEFSEQILEKIKRNHEEVIFLYNMLNDKEKELKEAVREIDVSKKRVQDILDTKTKNEQKNAEKEMKNLAPAKPVTQADSIEKKGKAAAEQTAKNQEISSQSASGINNNTQILSLYSEGKSIMEISKLLDLGQGEVKLVIDLFKGKK
jgi:hypothetical protein